jgi:hypothetical protein
MRRILALIVGLLLAGAADACSCAFAPLGTKEAQAARNVFVFRLMDARMEQTTAGASSNWVVGTVKILAQVRGSTKTQQIRFSTFYCCGSRLEVGKNYIAFLSSDTLRFDGNASNLVPLWEDFDREDADALEAVLHGKKQLEDVFAYGLEEINQVRPPPPPCPPQGKKSR